MSETQVPAAWLSVDGLVSAFYNSFIDEESFKGDERTLELAQDILDRGTDMWNHPTTIKDAEEFVETWHDTH